MADWREIIAARTRPMLTPIAQRKRRPGRARCPGVCRRCNAAFFSQRRGIKFCSRLCGVRHLNDEKKVVRRVRREKTVEATRAAIPKGYYELRRERLIVIRRQRQDYLAAHAA